MHRKVSLSRVAGPGLVLRLIEPEDAEYVHGLRVNPAYNQHLSQVRGTADDQRRWILDYKVREAAGEELYYIVERGDGERCGTVRLYDIDGERFTWGSWILDHNKPRKAALESAYLVYEIAFDRLGLSRAVFEVRRDNENTLGFHLRFGATETHSDPQNTYFEYPREVFEADRPGYLSILQQETDP